MRIALLPASPTGERRKPPMAATAKPSGTPANAVLKQRDAREESPSASLATVLVAIEDQVIAGRLQKNAALTRITEAITKVPAIEGAMIALSHGSQLVCCASSGTAPLIGSRISSCSGLSGECVSNGRMVRCDDALVDPRVDVAAGDRSFGSAVILPLPSKGASRGVLAVFAAPHGISSELTTAFGTAATLAGLLGAELQPAIKEPAVQPKPTLEELVPPRAAASSSPELPPTEPVDHTRAEVGLLEVIRRSQEARRQAGEPADDELSAGRTPHWRKAVILVVLILASSGLLLARFYPARPSPKAVQPPVTSSPRTQFTPAVTEVAGSPALINTQSKRPAGEITGGALVQRQLLVYPPSAISNGVEGHVAAVLVVTETGVVEEVRISSGNATLAQSAAAALAHWRYAPFKADGQSVRVKVPVTVSFRLVKPAN